MKGATDYEDKGNLKSPVLSPRSGVNAAKSPSY